MSKIVTMKCQVPWISPEDTYERLKRVLPEMPVVNGLKCSPYMSQEKVIIGTTERSLVSVYKNPNDSTMQFKGDDVLIGLTNKIMDELLLDTIKEKALRNKYHVTVSREKDRMTVLLER
ncbi:MAG: hypothetical protein JNL74_18200 [Fibrobacteres bacterium]|nr:hypothetical protein [Fibrobacterota bacterium]